MRSLDEVRAELAAIQGRLAEMPDDAFEERLELKSRQEELRAEAADLRQKVSQSKEEMTEELERLERRLKTLTEGRPDRAEQVGRASEGGGLAARTAADEDQDGEKQEVVGRIAELRRRLERR